jgi:hypothetical protein
MANEPDDWYEDDEAPTGGPRAGILVAAVTNFLVGALVIVGGVILATSGVAALAMLMNQASATSNLSPDDLEKARGVAAGLLNVIALLLMAFGLAAIVAGVGVLRRDAWGRTLSMVLGAIAGVLGILCLVTINPYGVVVFGAHAMVMLLVLNDKDYTYQFQ